MLKNLLFVLGLVLLIAAGVLLYVNQEQTRGTQPDDELNVEQISLDFLSQQAVLREININSAFFSEARVSSLIDFRTTVPSEPAGRANPFAPVTGPVPTPIPATTAP